MSIKIASAFFTAALAITGVNAVWPAPQCLLRSVLGNYKTIEFGKCLSAMHAETIAKGEPVKADNIRRAAWLYGAPIEAAPKPLPVMNIITPLTLR